MMCEVILIFVRVLMIIRSSGVLLPLMFSFSANGALS